MFFRILTVNCVLGALPVKEWKPKTTQKSSVSSPGVIGSPVKSVSHLAVNSKNVESKAELLQDNLSQVNFQESQNVIIAQHIRVPENDRCRLTFGTFGLESESPEGPVSTFQAVDNVEEPSEPSPRFVEFCWPIISIKMYPWDLLPPSLNIRPGLTGTEFEAI